jgi:hypothetical protein
MTAPSQPLDLAPADRDFLASLVNSRGRFAAVTRNTTVRPHVTVSFWLHSREEAEAVARLVNCPPNYVNASASGLFYVNARRRSRHILDEIAHLLNPVLSERLCHALDRVEAEQERRAAAHIARQEARR